MKNAALFFIVCLVHIPLFAQDDVSIGKYKKFQSGILGGEVTYLVHLPDGYENSQERLPCDLHDERTIGLCICKRCCYT